MTTAADRFLAGKKAQTRPRLIFALDATASRQPTWDMAVRLQAEMFREVAVTLAALDVQLLYYRGIEGFDGECKASRWTVPTQLTAIMQTVKCRAGETQIGKILAHVRNEHQELPVGAVVFVGDACEENGDALVNRARLMGPPAFMFQEGDDRDVEKVFRAIAAVSKGAYARFDSSAAQQLAALLKAALAFVTGGVAALATRKDEASIKLLSQLK